MKIKFEGIGSQPNAGKFPPGFPSKTLGAKGTGIMEKKLTGKQLIDSMGIAPFDIINWMKQGLRAYAKSGQIILHPEYLRNRPPITKELKEKIDEFRATHDGPILHDKQSIQNSIERGEIRKILDSPEAYNFVETLFFYEEDLEKFNAEKGPEKHDKQVEGTQTVKQEGDFINSLKMSRESNSGIEIKAPGKNPEAYDYERLGFKNERTKEWKTLIEVLENKEHVLSLGPAGRFYDAQRKRLVQINKKLIDFFNKQYSMKLPYDFKLYELCKDGQGGTYRFKFQVVDNLMDTEKTDSEYRNKTKEQLLKEFEQLAEKYQMRPENGEIIEKMAKLSKILLQKKWITEAEIGKMIRDFKPETEIKYDRYESMKDLPPQY